MKKSSLNIVSNNIFLYEVVISTSYGQIPITQMLSESHDTLSIFRWLSQRNKSASKSPNEVVCDFSRALLGALTRTFCEGSSVRGYVETCFLFLHNHTTELPSCFIRIDVAHIIKMFCRIKCLVGLHKKHLKEFYVRCLKLLMESVTLEEFKTILNQLLTVALSETDGWVDANSTNKTHSEKGREFLIHLMKDSKNNYANEEFLWSNETEVNNEKYEEIEEAERSKNQLEIFLEDILDKSKANSKQSGNRISAYYLSELVNILCASAKIFHIGPQL